jgi:hypothetical protein
MRFNRDRIVAVSLISQWKHSMIEFADARSNPSLSVLRTWQIRPNKKEVEKGNHDDGADDFQPTPIA